MLLNLEQIGKSFGEKVVLEHVTASVEREDRIGIVARTAPANDPAQDPDREYTDYTGEFSLTHGVTVGIWPRNAKLDVTLDVYGEMRSTFAPVLDAMAQMQIVERKMAASPSDPPCWNSTPPCRPSWTPPTATTWM